jgi:hypothetical protein
MKKLLMIIAASISATAFAQDAGFKDTAGKHLDILHEGKPLVRYMYEYDAERRLETYKPWHHVMDATGTDTITKGDGGQFPHHRAIYIGWNRLGHQGKTYDLWHMKNEATQLHQKVLKQEANENASTLTALIHWVTEKDVHAIAEKRTVVVHHTDNDAHLLLDFTSELTAVGGDVVLKGDPEHSGFQYRPHNDVSGNKSAKYLFHAEGIDPKKDLDLPWVANTHEIRGVTYTVQHMNHPNNPKGYIYSAYRDYGRFGSTFYPTIKDEETLSLNYRIRITTGERPSRESLAKSYTAYSAH